MPQVFVWAAIAAITVLFLKPQSPADVPKAPSVGIYMDFETAPSEESVQVMEKEVSQILQASGVSLDWRSLKDNHGSEPFAGLVVLKFKGACRAGGLYPILNDAGSIDNAASEELGSTRVDRGHVLPYTEVECDRVRQALAYLGPAGQKERQHALGIALARVVSHELYHVLASTTAHAEKGIAKASHPLEDLIPDGKLALRNQESLAIQNAFSKK
ncbi:MAG TPA: hypothetical protein VMH81_09480 [Bryobacteraceae bacterium]|nr:hypothetical protein [Bryobacteraceae bacterium]